MKKKVSHIRIRLKQNAERRSAIRTRELKRRRHISNNSSSKVVLPVSVKPRSPEFVSAEVPMRFCVENIEESLKFINEISSLSTTRYNHVNFDMRSVISIDMMSISWLLSLVNLLYNRNISSFGNTPLDPVIKEKFISSGFLDFMQTKLIKPTHRKYENQFYMVGKEHVDSVLIGTSVKKSIGYLLGEEDSYPPVYDNMIEICANSVEHANKVINDKNWLISISYDQDKVRYILTDTGIGILATLRRKNKELFSDLIRFKGNAKVLEGVFKGAYQSQTKEINRHKGLPEVYQSFSDGFISDLLVLSNCVLYDFQNNSSEILKNEFKGVMITWTISKNNIKLWKKSLLEY